MAVRLEARLGVRPREARRREEFAAQGAIVNVGDETAVLNLAPLSSPSLALEIVDSIGFPVRLPPPPVPGGEARVAQVTPGQSYVVEYPGFLPQWTPPGAYRVRLRYTYRPGVPSSQVWAGTLLSDWVEFTVLR